MKLYVDIQNRRLVASLSSDRQAQTPIFMQGDNEPLEIHLLSSGEQTLFDDKVFNTQKDFLRIAIARFKGDPKMLSFIAEYEPIENGGCIAVLPLNTNEIETALGNNPSLDAYLEIEYSTSDGRITTILQTPCKLKNDLIDNVPNIEVEPTFLSYQIACENAKASAEEAFNNTQSLLATKVDNSEIIKIIEKQNGCYLGSGFFIGESNTINVVPSSTKPMYFTFLFKCIEKPKIIILSGGDYDIENGSNILSIDNENKKLLIFKSFDYENYETEYLSYDMMSEIEAGDKVSVSYDNFILNIYRKKYNSNQVELLLTQEVSRESLAKMYLNNIHFGEDYFSECFFIRNCLSSSFHTGYYTIKSFFNGEIPPAEILTKSDFIDSEISNFNSSFSTPNQTSVVVEKNASYDGQTNCLCVYPSAGMGFHSLTLNMSSLFPQMSGKKVYIVFEVYYPTSNVNSNIAVFSASKDTIINPSDSWQTVRYPPYENGSIYLSFRHTSNPNIVGTGSKNDDVIYIRKIRVEYATFDIAIFGTPDSSTLVKNNIIGELAHNGMKYFRKNIESNLINSIYPKIREPKFTYDFEITNTNASFSIAYLRTYPNLSKELYLTSIELIVLENSGAENFTFKFDKSSKTLASETIITPVVGDRFTYQIRKPILLNDFIYASIVVAKMTNTTSGKVKINLNFTKENL